MYKQANKEHVSYPDAVKRIIQEDGLVGLFGRGLSTKIMANGLQVRCGGGTDRQTDRGAGHACVACADGADRGSRSKRNHVHID